MTMKELDSFEESNGVVHFRFTLVEQRQILSFLRGIPFLPPALLRVCSYLSSLGWDPDQEVSHDD